MPVRLVPRAATPRTSRPARPRPLYYFDRHLVGVARRARRAARHGRVLPAPRRPPRPRRHGRGLRDRVPVPRVEVRRRGPQHRHPLQRPRQPQGAAIRTYPVVERNGFVLVWYHPDDEAADVGGRRASPSSTTDEFTGPIRTHYVVDAGVAGDGARTASTRPTSATCTTPRRCPRSSATRPTSTELEHAVAPEVPDAPRRGRRPHRHATPTGPGVEHRAVHAASSTRCSLRASDADRRARRTETRFDFYVRDLGDETTNSTRRQGVRRTRSTGSSPRTRRSGSTRPTSCGPRWPTPTARS